MKSLSFLLLFSLFFITCSQAQQPVASPRVKVSSPDKNITVDYGQPSRKGRTLFGPDGLEKYGNVWRTGANEATQITFVKDMTFGNKPVKAGTYTLFTIPGEKEWAVILNGQLGQWGAYDYAKNKAKDVLQVTVPAEVEKTSVEKMSITPTNDKLTIAWGEVQVNVPVK
jgi:hypothetical protein